MNASEGSARPLAAASVAGRVAGAAAVGLVVFCLWVPTLHAILRGLEQNANEVGWSAWQDVIRPVEISERGEPYSEGEQVEIFLALVIVSALTTLVPCVAGYFVIRGMRGGVLFYCALGLAGLPLAVIAMGDPYNDRYYFGEVPTAGVRLLGAILGIVGGVLLAAGVTHVGRAIWTELRTNLGGSTGARLNTPLEEEDLP